MPEWTVPGYTEIKALGAGGFGHVILARHDASGTLVAIKYLHQDLLADHEFAEMFRAEAAVLAALDNPNVVRLYEYVESAAGAAIVMELIGGVSLREILRLKGKTTAEAALTVLQGSLLGLAAAHRCGVVHRDYKPENVLVDGAGFSKLTDFGIAARAGDQPIPAGTLAYAPPEQFSGAPASPAGDVYSATATFYECLVGRPPFLGEDTDLVRQHRCEPVPLEPVPEALRSLMAAGMAKDPARRPGDATTLVTELAAVAPGAYGRDWHERGRSHLSEAALLLAALWPVGPPPAMQGSTLEQVHLSHGSRGARGSRHWWHLRHVRHEQHLRHLRRLRMTRAAMAGGAAVVVVAAGTALAVTVATRPPAPKHPVAAAHPVSLRPSPTVSASPAGGEAAGAPTAPATTTVQVSVSASEIWIDTGLRVTAGELVQITAQGSWTPDGENSTGPDGFGNSLLSADNYFDLTDLGTCAYCASHDYPNWAMLIAYTGDSPPGPGSYTSTSIAPEAMLIKAVGSSFEAPWPYTGELWLGFNDDAYSGNTSDNSGQVAATVTVSPQ